MQGCQTLPYPAASMKRYRVLVCGTNYGQTYIQAIQQSPETFELAGILARGSLRSIKVAGACGVPLYQSVESLGGEIDIACAAMGTSGADVVLRLLERRIHVLCEHPQTPDFLDSALRSANASQTCFHINGHFASLKAASAFIRYCRLQSQSADPVFFDAMITDRSLYASLDILRRVAKTFEPFNFSAYGAFAPFTVVQGTLGGIPATFQVQPSRSEGHLMLQDGDSSYYVDYRLAVVFPQGILTMLSVAGPVIWNSNLGRPSALRQRTWTSVYSRPPSGFNLYGERIKANLNALRCLVKNVRQRVVPAEQSYSHLSEVSIAWKRIGALVCGKP